MNQNEIIVIDGDLVIVARPYVEKEEEENGN